MAFTNNMSVIIPAGSVAANLIDNHIRQTRLDFKERLASVFNDLDVDPMTFKASFIAYLATIGIPAVPLLPVNWHWSRGVPMRSSMEWSGGSLAVALDGVHPTATATDLDWMMDLGELTGKTPTTYTAVVYRDAGASISMRLYKESFSTPGTFTQVSAVASASTGWHTIALTAQTTLIDSAYGAYFIIMSMTSDGSNANSCRFAGLQIDD